MWLRRWVLVICRCFDQRESQSVMEMGQQHSDGTRASGGSWHVVWTCSVLERTGHNPDALGFDILVSSLPVWLASRVLPLLLPNFVRDWCDWCD